MKVRFAEPFEDGYKKFPVDVKRRLEKQLIFLLRDLRHPSLHAKKFDETQDIWQARVSGYYRFYFQIRGGTYYILNILKHKD